MNSSINNKAVEVVYILGAGHCGSTLLNMLLNGHSKVLGLSEIDTINFERLSQSDNKSAAEFWHQVREQYVSDLGETVELARFKHPSASELRKWTAAERNIYMKHNGCLFRSIRAVSGKIILVDSSKSWQRLLLLAESNDVSLKVIHLVRDGRAIVNSYHVKYGSFRVGFLRWLSSGVRALLLKNKFLDSNWLQVGYEKLTADPTEELKAICSFIGIAFESAMLDFRAHADLGIGGNRMRSQRVATIRVDEGWKCELPWKEKLKFLICGSWLNRIYGYRIWTNK